MVELSMPSELVLDRGRVFALVRVHLNDDGETEYVTLPDVNARYEKGEVFYRDGEQRKRVDLWVRTSDSEASSDDVDMRLDPIGTTEPPFRDMTIGGLTFGVVP